MTARTNIETEAWGDLRFKTLARLCGLADSDHALIKCARIWAWQTEHFTFEVPTYVVDVDTIESALGPGSAPALVRSRLAEEVPEGFRIKGSLGRIEWLARRRRSAPMGGEAMKRKRSNIDQPGGYPPGDPRGYPQASPLTPTLTLAPEDLSLASPRARARDPVVVAEPTQDSTRVAEPRWAYGMAEQAWLRLNELRHSLTAELGLEAARQVHLHDPGRLELQARLQKTGPEKAADELNHVFAVLEREARGKGTVGPTRAGLGDLVTERRDISWVSFHAPMEIVPGMVVRIPPHYSRADTATPACADRIENVLGVYGMATTSRLSGLGGECDVCSQGALTLSKDQWKRVLATPIVPGQIYFLSDLEPGGLSAQQGNFVMPIAIGVSATSMQIKIGMPALRLFGRIVESAWIRDDRKAFALVFADGEQQVWEVASDDDDDSRIEDIKQALDARHPQVTGDLPKSSLRGAFTSYLTGLVSKNPSRTHEDMVIGDMNATIVLSGRGAILGARPPTDRAMYPHEKWTEV